MPLEPWGSGLTVEVRAWVPIAWGSVEEALPWPLLGRGVPVLPEFPIPLDSSFPLSWNQQHAQPTALPSPGSQTRVFPPTP